ncbi:MAG: hypothetical protein KKD11_03360 [Candidatus Omnitrophica bacterium]|nr:hypothetical protein [Candidatus Omnitrophota bacterium]
MKKKHPQKSRSTSEYDPQRQQNVLLERIEKKVDIIAEGHGGLDRKIDKTNERLDDVNSKLDIITNKVSEHSSKLSEHGRRFDRIEMVLTDTNTRVKKLESGHEELRTGQENIVVRLDKVEHKLGTITTDHEHRMQKLESVK